MPPRPSVTSFSVSDPTNEVVCPLTNQDGSQCRKRCFGEKRFRSMQEHIRRAHPQYYISKLPATEESFHLMINKTPSDPLPPEPQDNRFSSSHGHDQHGYHDQGFNPAVPNHLRRGSMLQSANAAAALAQLHNSRPEGDWQADEDAYGDTDNENAYLTNYFANTGTHDMFGENPPLPDRDFMGPPMQRSLSGRASSLQPNYSKLKPNRPRKSSVTENARKPKHERDRSKELKRLSSDRKSYSAEPTAYASNKRWEDLLDAAASATEEDSRDLTPIPQSPRSSVPPNQSQGHAHPFQSYTTSPLQNAVLTHSPDEEPPETGPAPYNPPPHLEPFPSVEASYDGNQAQPPYHHHQSSNESVHSPMYSNYPGTTQHHHNVSQSSGTNFHIPHDGLSSSPPQDQSPHQNRTTSFSRSTHYPHALHQAAAQAAAAQQQQSVQQHSQQPDSHQPQQQQQPQPQPQQQQHPYSAHHATYSAHQQNSLPSLQSQHSGMSPTNHGHLQAPTPPSVQHYCAACHRITPLNSSYACTECICGICRDCVDVLISMDPTRGAGCPRCHVVGGRFKPFMLDLR